MNVQAEIKRIHDLINQLIKEYELYFNQINKRPPQDLFKEVSRRLRDLNHELISSTVLKFQVRSLNARFTSYNQYWQSILRKIEEGTFYRDGKRAFAPQMVPSPPLTSEGLIPSETEQAEGPPEEEIPPAEKDTSYFLNFYREYVMAKKSIGESLDGMSFEKMTSVLKRKEQELKKGSGIRDVDFEVEIKDNKVKIKAVSKK